MNEHELSGGYYKMGQQYGALLKRDGFSPPSASPEA